MQSTQSFIRAILFASLVAITAAVSQAQTSIAASLYGAFNQSTNGDNTKQSPSNAAGGLLEVRHIHNPLIGYEATYSYNRANQGYANSSYVCPVGGIPPCTVSHTAAIPANAHEISGDWVISVKAGNLRPFALAGGGLLLNVPSGGTVTTVQCGGVTNVCLPTTTSATTSTSTQGVFVYGAGLDWELLPHLGLRLQYRGNVYKAAALTSAFSSTNAFTHTAEPVIGIYFRL